MEPDLTSSSTYQPEVQSDETQSHRMKTSLRMLYAAETKIFIQQHGGLEDIRGRLGLSRRKMCQLLMVDPSAWTRWVKDEGRVPPHIYRSLEWFLALNQKALTQPDLAAYFHQRLKLTQNREEIADLPGFRNQIGELQREISRQKQTVRWLMFAIFALIAVFFANGLTI